MKKLLILFLFLLASNIGHTQLIGGFGALHAEGAVGGINDPTDISGLYVWLKGDVSNLTYVIDGTDTVVTSWNDASGNNFDFDQTLLANKPRLRKGALNGEDVIDFDGVNDVLTRADDFNVNSYMTVISVFKIDGAHGWDLGGGRTIGCVISQDDCNKGANNSTAGAFYVEHDRNYTGTLDRILGQYTDGTKQKGGLNVPGAAEMTDGPFIDIWQFRNDTEELYHAVYDNSVWLKDSLDWAYTTLLDANGLWRVGGGDTNTGIFLEFNGRIAEIIIYFSPNASTSDVHELMENYLIPKYGL